LNGEWPTPPGRRAAARTPCRWSQPPDFGTINHDSDLAGIGKYGVGQPNRWLRMKPLTSNEQEAVEFFRNLGAWFAERTIIDACRKRITDEHVPCLKLLPDLDHLDLADTSITDASMPTISSLTKLGLLSIGNTAITDSGATLLASLRSLRSLAVNGTRITDDSTSTIGSLTSINMIFIGDTAITDAGIQVLANLRGLRAIEVHRTKITREGITDFRQLVKGCLVRSDYGLFEPLNPPTTDDPQGPAARDELR